MQEDVETYLSPDRNPRLSVPSLLAVQARRRGDSLALSAMSLGRTRRGLAYAQLHLESLAAAAALGRAGLRPGDRLGIYLTNDWGLECFLAALGALTLGAVAVPLNTRASAEEIRHAIDLVQPRLIVAAPEGRAWLSGSLGNAPVECIDPSLLSDHPDGSETQPPDDPGPDALGCLLFTSGTTARAKAVMHSHRTMIATGACTGSALGLRSGDIYQGAFPFFTSSALNLAGMSCWMAGAGLVLEGQIGTSARLDLIQAERTTFYHGVPSILNFMTQEYDPRRHDLRRVRTVANGGAAMPVELMDRIAKLWPWVEQVQIYGMTESGPAGTVLPPERVADKMGSVGCAMTGMTVEILDETGLALGPGEMGEIALTGPSVALGYYRNPEASAEAFEGRRIRTGDVGRLDDEGFLFFGDRKKDLINRGGLKIASVRVEEVLYRHPDVVEAAAVAMPHKDLGEDVVACVVLRKGAQAEMQDLLSLCRTALADYEAPRKLAFLDSLPKNPMGKILKKDLREILSKDPGLIQD